MTSSDPIDPLARGSTEIDCRSCGGELPAEARFCLHCGAAVEAGPASTADRERKVATFLFADLAGFTGLGEAHDPELVSHLVASRFERLAEEVVRHEGTIEKFAGDALLAVFGVPAAHEDDPERAVRAALAMQAIMAEAGSGARDRPDLELRVGIATGEVLVDRARLADQRDLFVTGDAVNTAARLQAAADPGTIVVSAATERASRDAVDYEALPPLELKGKADPVTAFRARAARQEPASRARHGIESPMVGRDAEMELLKDAVRRMVAADRPRLVTVLGSAGVGKSRLARELETWVDALPESFHWRKGRCLAYGNRSLGPIGDVVKADAHIADDDPPAAAREKLAARLADLSLGEDEAATRDALEAILGIGEAGKHPRDALVKACHVYLAAMARLAPLILVVEDIHWADEEVLSLLGYLARWGEGPMLLLCPARHELLEHRPGWSEGWPDATTIVLEPLGSEESTKLIDGLLAGDVPDSLRDRIVGLAEGNPLFAEEMVRMLVDRGVLQKTNGRWRLTGSADDIEIPDSVHAVLAARLDSLPRAEKRAAQDAAVIGRIFWDRLVAYLANEELEPTSGRLHRLRAKDLVVSREPSSLAGASEFGFRHVLIRDVAYDSLPKRDRAGLHQDIAHWAEGALADRIDEFGELIAGHLAAALSYEDELGIRSGGELRELREATHTSALRASRRAASLGLVTRACRWMWMAIDLAVKLGRPASEMARLAGEDVRAHGKRLTDLPDHATWLAGVVDDLVASSQLTDDDEQVLARLRAALAESLSAAERIDDARAVLVDGIARLEAGPPTPGRAWLRRTLGWSYWRNGPLDEALPLFELAILDAEAASDDETLRWAQHDIGLCHIDDDLDECLRLIEESYRLAREAGDRALISRCRYNLPGLYAARGDPLGPVQAMIVEQLQQERRETEGGSDPAVTFNLAANSMQMGRLDDALAYIDEAIAEATSRGSSRAVVLTIRALVHLRRGDRDAAARDEAALQEIDLERLDRIDHTYVLWGRALADWPSDPASASSELEQGLGSDRIGMHRWVVALEITRMALRLGDRDLLERAVVSYRESKDLGSRGTRGPALLAERRWVDGLIAADAGVSIEEAAAALEECDHIAHALDAWVDAALMAARAGRPSVALDRARAIMERTGMHPLLGELPETRWL